MNKWLGFTGVALFALGCSNSPSGGGPDGGGADLAPAGCVSDNMPVALEAHYAIQATLNVHVSVPAIAFDGDAQSSALLLADVMQSGSSVTTTSRACHIKIPPVNLKGQDMPVQLTASDALVQSVPAVTSTGTLSGTTTCASLTSMPIAIVLGAKLTNPVSDMLPAFTNGAVKLCDNMASSACSSTSDTSCICDQDPDGKPGATVMASGVPAFSDIDEIYLALRTEFSLDGQVYPSGMGQATPGQRLKGMVDALKLDQSPVGCHRTMPMPMDCDANTTAAVADFNPVVTQSSNSPSTFVALPVAAGYTCDMLVQNAGSLFAGQ